MIKFSILILLLTIPFLSSEPYLGIPLWVWGSLGATVLYAIIVAYAIETRWDAQKEREDG